MARMMCGFAEEESFGWWMVGCSGGLLMRCRRMALRSAWDRGLEIDSEKQGLAADDDEFALAWLAGRGKRC